MPYEHDEQAAVIAWCEFFPDRDARLIYAIPNQGRMGGKRGKVWGARMKAEGLREGMLDLHLPCARGNYIGLYVEMKRRKGGNVSDAQKRWIADLTKAGHLVKVARGSDEAIAEIQAYLRLGRRLPAGVPAGH